MPLTLRSVGWRISLAFLLAPPRILDRGWFLAVIARLARAHAPEPVADNLQSRWCRRYHHVHQGHEVEQVTGSVDVPVPDAHCLLQSQCPYPDGNGRVLPVVPPEQSTYVGRTDELHLVHFPGDASCYYSINGGHLAHGETGFLIFGQGLAEHLAHDAKCGAHGGQDTKRARASTACLCFDEQVVEPVVVVVHCLSAVECFFGTHSR